VSKFLDREIRRGRTYETIMLDPPSFGHGVRGEQFKFDRDLTATLERCAALLSELGSVLLTSHTEGVTAGPLGELMGGVLGAGTLDHGEMQLTGASGVRAVNAGVWVRWVGAATAPAEQDD
jgi:23S rRNA (cytosine1962-C5)-methyltransferase